MPTFAKNRSTINLAQIPTTDYKPMDQGHAARK